MPLSKRARDYAIALVLLFWSCVIAIALIFQYISSHGYLLADDSLGWTITSQDLVTLQVLHTSVRYASGQGSKDWDTILPSGGHIVHVDGENGASTVHTVALFHQLRCLVILQEEYENDQQNSPSPLAQHCLNYLRQTILCQMDISAETQSVTTRREGLEMMCHDWEVVYAQAEDNQKRYVARSSKITH